MIIIFWTSLILIIYCFLGYPVLLALVARFKPKPHRQQNIHLSVSVVIAVWNEQDVIGRKISNLLAQDYPADSLEILIGSDGSDDNTHTIVQSFNDPRITLLTSPVRQGKTAMLNRLIDKAKGDIIIFNDARQELEKDAFAQLVSHFIDPTIGCVSGELVFRPKSGGTAKGINLYWRYEKFMRDLEAQIHSMLGATGAIYAIRKSLYKPVPANIVLDDMYIPFSIIEQGYRAIFDNKAHAYDDVADNPKEEYRRKTRTLYGNYQMFAAFSHMFNPFKSPIAIQFFSHKFLRVIAPFLLITLFLSNLTISHFGFYRIIFYAQVLFYLAALCGALSRDQKYGILSVIAKLCYVPYVFCLLNFSAIIGFYRYLTAKQEITWQKARG